jgi:hypothetical protein
LVVVDLVVAFELVLDELRRRRGDALPPHWERHRDRRPFSGHTTTRVTLKTAGGSVIVEGVVVSNTSCDPIFCYPVDPIPLSSVGVLQPGSYVLEAVSTGSASTFYTSGQSFTPTSSGSYFVTLEASDLIAVPALSPGGLACLAAVLILASLPTLARLARVRD